jgi:beta-glucosidase/6-phospho-beta-glucosidase/beta-galactosidase
VKHWATINEPEVQVVFESVYNVGNWSTESCQTTKICTEVYTKLHILLIAHAIASKLYKSEFQVRHIFEILCYIYTLPVTIKNQLFTL